MAGLRGIGAIDLMLSIPGEDQKSWYDFMRPLFLDQDSREKFEMPAQYMFKDRPEIARQDDYVAFTVAEMDRHGIERAMISVGAEGSPSREALRRFPDRFFASFHANPNNAMDEVRAIER